MGPGHWVFSAVSFAFPTCKNGAHVPACWPCPLPKPLLMLAGRAGMRTFTIKEAQPCPKRPSGWPKGGHDFKDLVRRRQDGEGKSSRERGAVEKPGNRLAAGNIAVTSE